ncbi:MAG: energy transducer TonB [Bacteroidaceae bacterium]|nr:energy transducer TonB [Bacteroidaceae bacterium]
MQASAQKRIDPVSAAITGAIAVLTILLLIILGVKYPLPQEEAGVAVMMGSMGDLIEAYDYTEVAAPAQDAPYQTITPESQTVAQPVVTQDYEESAVVEDGEEIPQEQVTQDITAQRDSMERAAAAQANMLIANLFGESQATEPSESQSNVGADAVVGSALGNEMFEGKLEGTGGFSPRVDLNGRSVGDGGLVRPAYNVSEEGRVVVTIEVDPNGNVVRTSINSRSNTGNAALCNAAEQAALATKFNTVPGPDNQMGTITYYFRLK